MEAYRDSVAHLTDELKRIDLLVRRALVIVRGAHSATGGDEFRGLVISEPEIDELLQAGEFLSQHWRKQEAARAALDPIDAKLQEAREAIDQRRALTSQAGRQLTLPYLAERFGLSAAEVDLLLIAMAPELEPRYETLYAYLQDDVTRKRPSVDLALNLICRGDREKLFARRFLAPGAPLVHFHMIDLLEDAHDRQPTLLRRFLKIEDSLLRFLLEHAPTALSVGSYVAPSTRIEGLEVDEATRTKFQNLIAALERGGAANTVVHLIGSGPEVEAAAEALGHALQKPLIMVDTAEIESNPANLQTMVRDIALHDAVLAVSATMTGGPDEEPKRPSQGEKQLWRAVSNLPGPILLLGPLSAFANLPHQLRVWRLELGPPSFEVRRRTWESALTGMAAPKDTARLADTFRFGAPQIHQAASLAYTSAALRDPSDPAPSMDDVLDAGRSLTAPSLRRYAVAIQPKYTWADIVLPEEKLQQLRQISTRLRYRRTVHRDWGFGEKLSRGRGLNVLFTGPSGVGKTMAAEVLANDLSLLLFQIDLSTVVSKYIGETEKNLSAIFREAEMSQSLLFFDEADSLFGKRTEVKDAHDRYANLEVNYLLQRIEQFEGIVVLATNLQRNLDDAFLRRMQEVVEFPFPDEKLRERIWRQHLPASAPTGSDIDFAFLARQFKLTGSNIRNAVISAAFLAASESKSIGMADMIAGVKAELQKQGKLVMKVDFGKYFETAQVIGERKSA